MQARNGGSSWILFAMQFSAGLRLRGTSAARTTPGSSLNSPWSQPYANISVISELRASVLDCGSPLPIFHRRLMMQKRQRTAAVQNLAEICDPKKIGQCLGLWAAVRMEKNLK